MHLLSEDRDPLEILHYAIRRERGQENQQRIGNTHAQSPSESGINLIQRQRQQQKEEAYSPHHQITTRFHIAGNVCTNSSKDTSTIAQQKTQYATSAKQ